MHICTALSDLIFNSYAGLYGYNDQVLINEYKFNPYTDYNTHTHCVDTDKIRFLISDATDTYLL